MPGPWHVAHASTPFGAVLTCACASVYGASWQLVHADVCGWIVEVDATVQYGLAQYALPLLPPAGAQLMRPDVSGAYAGDAVIGSFQLSSLVWHALQTVSGAG
jgi:hypothetical protein